MNTSFPSSMTVSIPRRVAAGAWACVTLGITAAITAAITAWPLDAAAAEARPPGPGRYAARMCVRALATPARPADCGPVELWMQRGNKAQVRVSDIVYRLELNSSQVDVVLMHGAMQIDGFTAVYDWQGSTLQFNDREKGLRYEVHVGAPASDSR